MASTTELARVHTRLAEAEIERLQRLVSSWGLLADLCFSDLLLVTPLDHTTEDATGPRPPGDRLVVLGQVRPLTSQTLHQEDLMGRVVSAGAWPGVLRCLTQGEITEELRTDGSRVQCLPVRDAGRTLAVVVREAAAAPGRSQGELEQAYLAVYDRFATMVARGEFPYAAEVGTIAETPRVGDGAVVLDASGRVAFASPNAISALHRVGVHANAAGHRLVDLGLDESVVRTAFARRLAAAEELERGPKVTIALRCLPLLDRGRVTGALLLLRDVSELRRRDRLLLSKDATIREIHHRVKNNLQTISSLLRLQARRLESPEAKAALEESVRRIRSIALVHETLSREPGDDVPFGDIARPLVRMVEEGLVSPDRPVRFTTVGEAGTLPAALATPLSVVLTELLQNVVDHAFPADSGGGGVQLAFRNDGVELVAEVRDDGVGLPTGFDLEASTSLGLSIVRTLVTSELGGSIAMRRGGDGARPGTVVEVRVPLVAPAVGAPTGEVPVVRLPD